MTLVKLTIEPQPPSALLPIEVQFNPNAYSITKPVSWRQVSPDASTVAASAAAAAAGSGQTNRQLDAPQIEFGGGGSRTLTLQLFYDVTRSGPNSDVRTETRKIVQLTRIERGQNRPPACKVSWGEDLDFHFIGVVSNLVQNFVLFRAGGQPVRANLTVTFTEYNDAVMNKKETDPDLTTYLVKRGDTLSTIATAQYRDPTLWRVIAAANDIDDPRGLAGKIGQRLAIPQLT